MQNLQNKSFLLHMENSISQSTYIDIIKIECMKREGYVPILRQMRKFKNVLYIVLELIRV